MDSEAKAIVTAMLLHDRSIRTIEFYAEVHRERKGKDYKVLEAREGYDDLGRWYKHWWYGISSTEVVDPSTPSYAFDGTKVDTYERESNAGLTRAPDPVVLGFPVPPLLLGRFVEASSVSRLGELLLDSTELIVRRELDADGIVTVEGVAEANHAMVRVMVGIDTKHGYAPRRIETRDLLSNVPIEFMEVDEFRRFITGSPPMEAPDSTAGIWIPVRASWVMYSQKRPDMSDPKWSAFNKEIASRHIGKGQMDPRDQTVQQTYKELILKHFGPDGIPYEAKHAPLVLTTCVIFNLNMPMGDEKFVLPRVTGGRYVDGLRRINSRGEPLDDPDAELQEIEQTPEPSKRPSKK